MSNSLEKLKERIDKIEEAYEFTLAYAAQGLEGDEASKAGGQLRDLLGKGHEAMTGLAELFRDVVAEEKLEPKESFENFIAVLEQDTARARAAVKLTLDQPSISSQLVDNLNASLHVRTLLTDIFLVDEIIKKRLV